MSTVEQIKQLEQQKQALLGKAKEELLKQLEQTLADLAELGFYYELTERNAPKRKRRKRKTSE